jgi:hypothetical protein
VFTILLPARELNHHRGKKCMIEKLIKKKKAMCENENSLCVKKEADV